MGDVVWSGSCMSTELLRLFIPGIQRSFNIRSVPFLQFTPGLKADEQGVGTLLMEEAERIAREEHGSGRIAVISGKLLRS